MTSNIFAVTVDDHRGRAGCRLARGWVAVAIAGFALNAIAAEFAPGKTYFGRSNYIEYLAGDLPFILSAPHGGRLKPAEIPDRAKGTFAFDVGTLEGAKAIAAEFQARTGRHPHIIVCHLTRRKLDCNREIVEAAAGDKLAEQSWREYHGFIDAARRSVAARHGKGLFIDFHGHGHKEARLELGYLHPRNTYTNTDAALNAQAAVLIEAGSLSALAPRVKTPYAGLLRGPGSFGALLERNGFPSTPSPQKPLPNTPQYFNGGYSTVRHARDGAPIFGFQIESYSKGVRDNDESRKKFAAALYVAVRQFLSEQAGIKLEVAKPARDRSSQ